LPDGALLVADLGATNARFAIANGLTLTHQRSYRCAGFSSLAAAVAQYRQDCAFDSGAWPRSACMAVAAPLLGDRINMTNLGWSFSARELRHELKFDRLVLFNDFTALALSLRHLQPADLVKVGGGTAKPAAPIALIGPGSGTGVSGLIPSGEDWVPLAAEGGHVALASSNDREYAVSRQLREEFGHVSIERILSGPGLYHLYRILCCLDGMTADASGVEAVVERALHGHAGHCGEAVNMFCAWLGTAAADLSLTLGALGGCYIGGGVVPRLLPWFHQSPFRVRFEAKGRYRDYLAAIPTQVIVAGNAALIGCAAGFTAKCARVEASS
jgi:glucokinase